MILADLVHVLPTQLNVYEQGPLGGLPAAGSTFTSQWFDTWRPHVEDIIVPQTGAIVPADDTANLSGVLGVLLRSVGIYLLDVAAFHQNATDDQMILQIFGSESGALETAATSGFVLYAEPVDANIGWQKRFQINTRLFAFRWIYSPISAATSFKMTAALRTI